MTINTPADLFSSCAKCDWPLRPEDTHACDFCSDVFCSPHQPQSFGEDILCPSCAPREPAQRVVV